MSATETSVTLIGMPGVGKSTVGVLLAKALQRGFIDTDLVLQAHTGRSLQDLIDRDGLEAFLRMEEACVRALDACGAVIATGGSVVYSRAAMAHLKAFGPAVYLDLPPAQLERRVDNLAVRGVVMPRGGTLRRLRDERDPLYRGWADLVIDTEGRTQDQVVGAILAGLASRGGS